MCCSFIQRKRYIDAIIRWIMCFIVCYFLTNGMTNFWTCHVIHKLQKNVSKVKYFLKVESSLTERVDEQFDLSDLSKLTMSASISMAENNM